MNKEYEMQNECDAAWTPAYLSVLEELRRIEAKEQQRQTVLMLIDTLVAAGCLALITYLVFCP